MDSIHILIIEDNEGDILLTTDALNELGTSLIISIVNDGWEAIQFLEQNGKYKDQLSPNLILLDINLPKMNGHEVLVNIKSNEKLKHIPVIILSTSSSEEDIALAYKNLATYYITKPADGSDFMECITSLKMYWQANLKFPG